jgi:hypothetical protein
MNYDEIEEFGRVRLSKTFFMREFLYSEIGNFYRIQNIPDDTDLAIDVGKHLCEEILEPLQDRFGRIHIRSALRSEGLNLFGHDNALNCAPNDRARSMHIWDRKSGDGARGAMACVVVPAVYDLYTQGEDWRSIAWWIHDHLPYSVLLVHKELLALNLAWSDRPVRYIRGDVDGSGVLTQPGMDNNHGSHADAYDGLLNKLEKQT